MFTPFITVLKEHDDDDDDGGDTTLQHAMIWMIETAGNPSKPTYAFGGFAPPSLSDAFSKIHEIAPKEKNPKELSNWFEEVLHLEHSGWSKCS